MRTTGLVQLAALAALALLPGCRTVVERSELGWKPEEAYQAIANALPRADFGFGEAPGVVALAASERGHRGEAPDLSVLTDEQAFRVRLSVLRTRTILVPYAAVEEVSVEWCPFPNVPLALLVVVPAQLSLARVTFDARKVPGLLASIEVECDRLVALGAPRVRRDEPDPPMSSGFIVMTDPEGNEFCLD